MVAGLLTDTAAEVLADVVVVVIVALAGAVWTGRLNLRRLAHWPEDALRARAGVRVSRRRDRLIRDVVLRAEVIGEPVIIRVERLSLDVYRLYRSDGVSVDRVLGGLDRYRDLVGDGMVDPRRTMTISTVPKPVDQRSDDELKQWLADHRGTS
jgi:hypothetical protein